MGETNEGGVWELLLMGKLSSEWSCLSCNVRDEKELAFQDSEGEHFRWGSEPVQRPWGGNEDRNPRKWPMWPKQVRAPASQCLTFLTDLVAPHAGFPCFSG